MYPAKLDSRHIGRTKSCGMLWESDMDLSVQPLGVQSEKKRKLNKMSAEAIVRVVMTKNRI